MMHLATQSYVALQKYPGAKVLVQCEGWMGWLEGSTDESIKEDHDITMQIVTLLLVSKIGPAAARSRSEIAAI
jgi:hypothetical protein